MGYYMEHSALSKYETVQFFFRKHWTHFLKPLVLGMLIGLLSLLFFLVLGSILTFFQVAILVTNDMKRVSKYVRNRFKLWVKLGDKDLQMSQEQIDELKTFPTRESVENVIILQKSTID